MLIAFGGAHLPSGGVASLPCKTARHTATQADKAILGGDACSELGLVKRVEALTTKTLHPSKLASTKQELIERYAEVFTGLGDIPGVHHLHVDSFVPPVINGCRNIPLLIIDPLKQTL